MFNFEQTFFATLTNLDSFKKPEKVANQLDMIKITSGNGGLREVEINLIN
jgi:hypothetical protein